MARSPFPPSFPPALLKASIFLFLARFVRGRKFPSSRRSDRYLKKWYVDISNPVTKGQLMAEVDSPEVDQQLRQAQAALLQLKAAQVKAQSDVQIAQGHLQPLRRPQGHQRRHRAGHRSESGDSAPLRRIWKRPRRTSLPVRPTCSACGIQLYEKVTAPFDGIVTGRAYDTAR